MSVDVESIWERRLKLEQARRNHMKEVMAEYDNVHYAEMKKLREECGASADGHNWRFTDFGPTWKKWYACNQCGQTKVED